MPDAAHPPVPTPPGRLQGLKPVLERNITALTARRAQETQRARLQDRAADTITRVIGSMPFILVHATLLASWITVNLGLVPGVRPFDRTFVILATTASVEGIFISTFVLISHNRAQGAADRRADLDLQICLLAEHEVSRLIELTAAVARKVGVDPERLDDELDELAQDVRPERVMDDLDAETARQGCRAS